MGSSPLPGKWTKALAIVTTVVLYVVVLMGFVVTDTRSGQGCGHSWPLCHGQFVPAFTFHTMVEFSHRAVTGVGGLLVLILVIWAWRRFGQRPEVKALGAIGLGFVIVQAILGGLDVLWPQSSAILALHFGFALFAFSGVALLGMFLFQLASAEGGAVRGARPGGALRWLPWLVLAYAYGVVYLGAYVSHTGAGPACAGWPLCNGQIWPGFHGAEGIIFTHRLAALGAVVLVAWLFGAAARGAAHRPDLIKGAGASLVLVLLQALSGGYLVLSHDSFGGNMMHVGLMTLLFTSLSYTALQSLPEPGGHGAPEGRAAP